MSENKEWVQAHRELQFLRAAAATTYKSKRRRRKPKGLAAASPEEQRKYMRERAKKLEKVS